MCVDLNLEAFKIKNHIILCVWMFSNLNLHVVTLTLGLRPRQDKKARQDGDPGSTSYALGSAGECERMSPHTPKATPTWGVGVSKDSWIFSEQLQGSKPINLKRSLYHWKANWNIDCKMVSYHQFGHLKHKLWPKERLGVKLAIWFPTTKSQELTRFPCGQVDCNISLKSSWQKLQLCFKPHCNQSFAHKVMGLQSHRSLDFDNFGILTWESWDKKPFGCGPRGEAHSIL